MEEAVWSRYRLILKRAYEGESVGCIHMAGRGISDLYLVYNRIGGSAGMAIVVLWLLVTGQFVLCTRAIKKTEREIKSACSDDSDTPQDV